MKRWIIAATAPLAVLALAIVVPVFALQKSNPARSGPSTRWPQPPRRRRRRRGPAGPRAEARGSERQHETRRGRPAAAGGVGRRAGPVNEFFRQFFGDQPRRTVRSLGSGFIVNATATS